jgi:hypothetical protein
LKPATALTAHIDWAKLREADRVRQYAEPCKRRRIKRSEK